MLVEIFPVLVGGYTDILEKTLIEGTDAVEADADGDFRDFFVGVGQEVEREIHSIAIYVILEVDLEILMKEARGVMILVAEHLSELQKGDIFGIAVGDVFERFFHKAGVWGVFTRREGDLRNIEGAYRVEYAFCEDLVVVSVEEARFKERDDIFAAFEERRTSVHVMSQFFDTGRIVDRKNHRMGERSGGGSAPMNLIWKDHGKMTLFQHIGVLVQMDIYRLVYRILYFKAVVKMWIAVGGRGDLAIEGVLKRRKSRLVIDGRIIFMSGIF